MASRLGIALSETEQGNSEMAPGRHETKRKKKDTRGNNAVIPQTETPTTTQGAAGPRTTRRLKRRRPPSLTYTFSPPSAPSEASEPGTGLDLSGCTVPLFLDAVPFRDFWPISFPSRELPKVKE